MSNFDNTNRGGLFKNDRKEAGDKKPEYTGSVNVEGVEFFLDAWLKKSAAGASFMSISVKRKDKQPQVQHHAPAAAPPPRQQPANHFADMADDMPFATVSMYYDMTTSKARKMSRYDY
jgi:hypothetical protein